MSTAAKWWFAVVPENTGSINVLTDPVKPFLSRAVMDMLDRQILEAQEECVQALQNRRLQLNRVELKRVGRDQRLY